MANCDDGLEDLPEVISNYHFEDDKELISFSVLPIAWTAGETIQGRKKHVYVHGDTDGGLQKIFKQVIAWKFELSGERPEISVLSKDNNWITLQKPRKSYEKIVRTVLITVNFLHVLKKNPELSEKDLWDKLSRIFRVYDNRPFLCDLLDHKALIAEAVKRDGSLTKSKYLMAFLEDKLQMGKRTDKDALTKEKRKFIVDHDDSNEDEDSFSEEEDSSSEEGSSSEEDDSPPEKEDSSSEQDECCGKEEAGDSVCCICDDGGTLLICQGICMRSFHPTRKSAKKTGNTPGTRCVSLGLSKKEVKGMPIFKCRNCLRQRHQCFSCGQLGSSDKSSGTEVFKCVNATCGYFYHPHCVAKLLNRDSEAAEELKDRILAGESFTCPLHFCVVCKRREEKTVPELQMAVCRRCPKAYHRKCLPRQITFEDNEKDGIKQRAWKGLLVNRILIYCLKHEICNVLKTPVRNHLKFPDDEKVEELSTVVALKKEIVVSKKEKPLVGETCHSCTAIQSKKRTIEDSHLDKGNGRKSSKSERPDMRKTPNGICSDLRTPERNHNKCAVDEKRGEHSSVVALEEDNVIAVKKKPSVREICHSGTAVQSKKRTVEDSKLDNRNDRNRSKLKGPGTARKLPYEKKSCLAKVTVSPGAAEHKTSLGDQLYELFSWPLDSHKPSKPGNLVQGKLAKKSKHCLKKLDTQVDSDSEQRILNLMKEASSNFSLREVIKKCGKPASGVYKMDGCGSITQGRVEGFCEAIRAAVRKLDEGGSIEDAQTICEPMVLDVVKTWKDKLSVYLAPFLFGMCYTSFGRHFMKVDKLKEIVDEIHYYVNNGDTIVDFCCGANDFSQLMKEKLECMGKNCFYKNYDLHPAKNDFNLEIRDWFTVALNELPSGSRLIIGLNPPFGVKAQLANKFINKALEFKPKLLILVAPPETERLDKKPTPYDLIWKDTRMLSGKSFYLPGSVDVNGKQIEDWNKAPPVLYLWSRPDWTARHKAIAKKVGQLHVESE